jgi:hypothetical protein
MNNYFAPLLWLKSTSIEEHYGLKCVTLSYAAGEVLGPQLRWHQGCGVLSEGTRSLIATKHMMATAAIIAHPMFVACTKV